jgi:hypothetical protein
LGRTTTTTLLAPAIFAEGVKNVTEATLTEVPDPHREHAPAEPPM